MEVVQVVSDPAPLGSPSEGPVHDEQGVIKGHQVIDNDVCARVQRGETHLQIWESLRLAAIRTNACRLIFHGG